MTRYVCSSSSVAVPSCSRARLRASTSPCRRSRANSASASRRCKWVSIIGGIMMGSLSLCFGRIGDIIGRRRVYRTGVFHLRAGLWALGHGDVVRAPHGDARDHGCRAGDGEPAGGAIMAASSAPERRGQVLGLFASFMAAGQLTGPTMGGVVLDLAGWRAIFVFNMAMGCLLIVAQQLFLKGHDERQQQTFDLKGALLLLIGYPALLIGVSRGPHQGWDSTFTLLWFGIAIVGLALFFRHEARFSAPPSASEVLPQPRLLRRDVHARGRARSCRARSRSLRRYTCKRCWISSPSQQSAS